MRLLHRASLVFLLMDIYSKAPITTAIILCNGKQNPYILKDDGHYVFSNLYPGDYLVSIRCKGYSTLRFPLKLKENETQVITTDLSYTLDNPRISRIRKFIFEIKDNNKPLKNEEVILKLDNKIKFIKLTNPVEKNSYEIGVNIGMNRLFMLQRYIYKVKNREHQLFFTGYDGETGNYILMDPVKRRLAVDGEFSPYWILKTNSKGQIMMPFMQQFMKEDELKFEIRFKNKRAKTSVNIEENSAIGNTFYLTANLEDYVEEVIDDEDDDDLLDEELLDEEDIVGVKKEKKVPEKKSQNKSSESKKSKSKKGSNKKKPKKSIDELLDADDLDLEDLDIEDLEIDDLDL